MFFFFFLQIKRGIISFQRDWMTHSELGEGGFWWEYTDSGEKVCVSLRELLLERVWSPAAWSRSLLPTLQDWDLEKRSQAMAKFKSRCCSVPERLWGPSLSRTLRLAENIKWGNACETFRVTANSCWPQKMYTLYPCLLLLKTCAFETKPKG